MTQVKLTEAQRHVLAVLDMSPNGTRLNAMGWPMMHEDESPINTMRIMWAQGWLVARGLIEADESDENMVWLSLTPAGREALETADE